MLTLLTSEDAPEWVSDTDVGLSFDQNPRQGGRSRRGQILELEVIELGTEELADAQGMRNLFSVDLHR